MNAANLAAYVLALVLGLLGAWRWGSAAAATAAGPLVMDARGQAVAPAQWRRIASLDLVGDELLALLAEPARIAAVSRWARGPEAWRLAGVPRLAGLDDLEGVLRATPDLVLVSTAGGEADRIARLRSAGIAVFDLGPAGGAQAYAANLRRVAALLRAPERGDRAARELLRRLAAPAPGDAPRRRALFAAPIPGGPVYGGTVGSSYHDILVAAGLDDAAAGRYAEPWPRLGPEDALGLDPELVVTATGGGELLRRLPGFADLPAVRQGRIVELPADLLGSPGMAMAEAAEALRRALGTGGGGG